MKQYIMGMLTGGALILFTIMFMERYSTPTNGRYIPRGNSEYIIDTVTGEVFYSWEGRWITKIRPPLGSPILRGKKYR